MNNDKAERLLRSFYLRKIAQAAARRPAGEDAPARRAARPPRRESPLATILMTAASLALISAAACLGPRPSAWEADRGIRLIMQGKPPIANFDSLWESIRSSFPPSGKKGDSL